MEQKKAYTTDVVLSRSVYTGHDKVTIKNHFKFVSICHKLNAAGVFCHAASSVDSITDYNEFDSRAARVRRHGVRIRHEAGPV